jgi:hypothetical protein
MPTDSHLEQLFYVRDGLLILPEKIIAQLIDAGVSREVTDRARRGLILTERINLMEFSAAFKQLLARIAPNSVFSA